MNDDETAHLLDSLAEGVESRAPLQDILRAGRVAARRRRAQRFVTGAVAAVVLVAGATTAVQGFAGNDRPASDVPASGDADPVLTVAPGMRLVGIGRVVLEVPETWGTQEVACSGQPVVDTIYFESTSDLCLVYVDQDRTSSVGLFRLDTPRGRAEASFADTEESMINGMSAFRGPARCPDDIPTEQCIGFAETELIVVPSEGVVLTIRAGGDADADIDSLRLLPEGYTTVPYIEPGTPNGPAGNLILGARLRVDQAWEPAPGGYSGRIPVTVVAPEAGSVVAVGSIVTIDRLDRPEASADPGTDEVPSALFDHLTFTLTLAPPNANGVVRSQLRVQNPTSRTITDPGCRVFANYSFGVVPAEDPDGSLPGMTLTRCMGPQDLPPGYDESLPGPTFDVTNLPPGDYLASMDYRDLRSQRLTAPLQVPPR